MPRGGARTRSGPQPAEHSQRKDREAARAERDRQTRVIDDGDWKTLPRSGRTANPPAWPLTKPPKPTVTSRRELDLWRTLWRKPQAMAWAELGMELQAAVYVRTLVRAEEDDSAIGLLNQVRIQADGLGLTPAGMNMLHWRIAKSSAAPSEAGGGTAPVTSGGGATVVPVKQRFKLVKTGG